MTKYYASVVDDSTTVLVEFKTDKARDKWLFDFSLRNQLNNDSWIDMIFEGKVSYTSECTRNRIIK